MKKIINYLNDTIKKEKNVVIFIIITFLLGLIFGSLFINIITKTDKNLLIEQLELFLFDIKKLSPTVFGIKAFLDNLLNNILVLATIFVLGMGIAPYAVNACTFKLPKSEFSFTKSGYKSVFLNSSKLIIFIIQPP